MMLMLLPRVMQARDPEDPVSNMMHMLAMKKMLSSNSDDDSYDDYAYDYAYDYDYEYVDDDSSEPSLINMVIQRMLAAKAGHPGQPDVTVELVPPEVAAKGIPQAKGAAEVASRTEMANRLPRTPGKEPQATEQVSYRNAP